MNGHLVGSSDLGDEGKDDEEGDGKLVHYIFQ